MEKEKIATAGSADRGSASGQGAKAAAKAKVNVVHGVPVYLVVLLVILGLVGGYAIFTVLSPPSQGEPPITGDNGPGQTVDVGPVNAIVLYSDECPVCEKSTTLLTFLSQNNIEYTVTEIETGSPAGQMLASKYKIPFVPAVLIDINTVVPELLVKTTEGMERLSVALRSAMRTDRYVVPESNLIEGAFFPIMYLENPDATCSVEEKPSVIVFCEPYSLACITNKSLIEGIWNDFGDEVNVEYRYVPMPAYTMAMLPVYGATNTEAAIDSYLCAQEAGAFPEMQDAVVDIYCDLTGDGNATEEEIQACSASRYFLKPLDAIIVNKAIITAGQSKAMDLNVFFECKKTIGEKKQPMVNTADLFRVRGVPLIVIDCKYELRIEEFRMAMCTLHPELGGCS